MVSVTEIVEKIRNGAVLTILLLNSWFSSYTEPCAINIGRIIQLSFLYLIPLLILIALVSGYYKKITKTRLNEILFLFILLLPFQFFFYWSIGCEDFSSISG